MTDKTLAILAIDQYRRKRLVQNVETWARARSLETHHIHRPGRGTDDVRWSDVPWKSVAALYMPIFRDLSYFEHVPREIPVIIDWDFAAGQKPEYTKCFDTHRIGRRPYLHVVDGIEAIDIDEPEDFELANRIMKTNGESSALC